MKILFIILLAITLFATACGQDRPDTASPDLESKRVSERVINIDQRKHTGDLEIVLKKAQVSTSETLVFYQINDPKDIERHFIRPVMLEYEDQVLRGVDRLDVDGSKVLVFPPLPADVNQFTITFPAMMSLDGPAFEFSLPVGKYLKGSYSYGESIPMDEQVVLGNTSVRFTELILYRDSFTLVCQPVDKTKIGPLFVSAPDLTSARDENNNTYQGRGSGATFQDPYQLKSQDISFEGSLDATASTLWVKVESSANAGEPVVFDIKTIE